MKKNIIYLSIMAFFAFLSLNVSAVSTKIIRNNKSRTFFTNTKELKENDLHFKNHVLELKHFNKNSIVFTQDEIQIEDWMTVGFCDKMENKNFLDQEPNNADWMIQSFNISKGAKLSDVEPQIESWMFETK